MRAEMLSLDPPDSTSDRSRLQLSLLFWYKAQLHMRLAG